MKVYSKVTSLIICMTVFAVSVFSQSEKYGHTNSGMILEAMPEVKSADKELAEFRKSNQQKLAEMQKEFQEKYARIAEKANAGEYSQIELQKKDAELKQEREKIGQFEQDLQQKIVKKREELLAPILEKVDNAIQAYGKENGYTMIFDVSVGGMLFAKDSENITDQIFDRLGIEKSSE